MDVAIAGSSGLIGTALVATLRARGHRVRRLLRGGTVGPDDVSWDPARGELDPDKLSGVDAAVNLAGENLAAGRWSAARKQRFRQSRIGTTRLLAGTLARLEPRPRVLVNASAIGWYGDRGDETLNEDSPGGSGFLAELCRDWEAAADPAADAGIRTVLLRIGVVMSAEGGALAKMLPSFRLGLGARLGDGRQFMSWIGRDDLVRAIVFALEHDGLAGPVNGVAPNPVRNAELTRTLGRVLRRPAFLVAPAFVLRLALGQMARETLLAGARILPSRLADAGFRCEHPELEGALRHELGR
jgi:uncharacterized protein (TIGR01777 family)